MIGGMMFWCKIGGATVRRFACKQFASPTRILIKHQLAHTISKSIKNLKLLIKSKKIYIIYLDLSQALPVVFKIIFQSILGLFTIYGMA